MAVQRSLQPEGEASEPGAATRAEARRAFHKSGRWIQPSTPPDSENAVSAAARVVHMSAYPHPPP